MRDGPVAAIPSPTHPDPRAEAVRWQICEAELIQAIGRGRAVNRTAENPLKIDIVTNYPLPIVVDELTTWALIQPTDVEIMRSRGAVPTTYRDMATAYPDLFTSEDAARKSLTRESALDINGFTSLGGQTPKESYLIGVCPGFLSIPFKRKSFHARPSKLLFDPKSIDPLTWLTERIGEVNIKGTARKPRSRSQSRRKRW
jgi:putative DNA primase/helicase